ncbi:MAG: sulfatase-like hydrolase/transferase [Opitutaceae bacterium]|nr:sulfatase-like hydrolase/transferase [Opitutaceae bacterium]
MKIQPLHRLVRRLRLALLPLLALAGAAALRAAPTNVIVIVADDLSWFDLGVNGATDVVTPNLDALARSGVNFRNAYVTAPICSPSRAGLMTGRYQQRFGHETNPGPKLETNPAFGLPATEATIAEHFKAINPGYYTGWIGKSHLGWHNESQPNSVGFDHFFGFLQSHHHYINANADPQRDDFGREILPENSDWIQRNRSPLTKNPEPFTPALELPYLTYLFSDEIDTFINNRVAASQPFLLYAPFNAVHFHLQAPVDLVDRYNLMAAPAYRVTLPTPINAANPIEGLPDQRQKLRVVLFGLDEAIGKLVRKLGTTLVGGRPLLDDTLIIFTSDNGGDTYFGGNNGHLRGRKTQLYEGGIRVPLLMYWKNRLPIRALDAPVSTLDILPTAIVAAGGTLPANLDGVSLLPYIANPAGPKPHDRLYWRIETNGINASDDAPDGLRAMREGDWKIVKPSANDTWELYNLAADESETTDLADIAPDRLRTMIATHDAWSAQMARPRWAWNQLLYSDPAFILEDFRVGSTSTSYLATDFLSGAGRFAYQDGGNALRHDAIDPVSGLPAQAPVLVDSGLAPLANPLVGPQWGLAAGSASLFYTKPGAGARSQIWRAMPGAPAALTNTTAFDSLAPRASRDLSDSAAQIAFMAGATASWANVAPPRTVNTIPFHSGGAGNGRWIPDTSDLAYAGTPPGSTVPQIVRLRTATNTPVQISFDGGAKSDVWAFRAPEFGGALCYAAVVRESGLPDVIGIYLDVLGTPGSTFQRVASLRIPPPDPLPAVPPPTVYFHSMRPLDGLRGFNGVSYFTCVVSANPNPAVPGESQVWLFGLGPDANNRVARRIDDGVGARFAPQTAIGASEVFAYYTRYNGTNPAQLRLASTGLGKPNRTGTGGWPALAYEWNFVAGTAADFNGTETTHLVPHGGKLYAGQGSVGNTANKLGNNWTGAQMLVKDSPTAAWRADRTFKDHRRVEVMEELTFTSRGSEQLATPDKVLVAAMSDFSGIGDSIVSVRTRDDAASAGLPEAVWRVSHPANPSGLPAFPSAFGTHRVGDATTGIHHIFAGTSSGEIHRGYYTITSGANMTWQTPASEPITGGGGAITGFAEANGLLYAASALKVANSQLGGGVLVRNDHAGTWQRVQVWTPPAGINTAPVARRALTGLTAVLDPRNSGRQVLLGALSWPGTIVRIDPAAAHAMTVELDVRDFFARRWNNDSLRTAPVTIGYTRFTPATHPVTGEPVHLIGLWIEHPDAPRQPNNGSHYLIRHADGTYEAADIQGMVPAVPNGRSLRASRAIAVSPFAADLGRVFYFGGYDTAGDTDRNTAWIVRGR